MDWLQEKHGRDNKIRAEAARRQEQILEADKALFPERFETEDTDNTKPISGESVESGESSQIERVEYVPPDPSWEENERALLDSLKKKDENLSDTLEEEPPGIDDVLKANGFASSAASVEDRQLADQTNVSVGTRKRSGYDLVRSVWCYIKNELGCLRNATSLVDGATSEVVHTSTIDQTSKNLQTIKPNSFLSRTALKYWRRFVESSSMMLHVSIHIQSQGVVSR